MVRIAGQDIKKTCIKTVTENKLKNLIDTDSRKSETDPAATMNLLHRRDKTSHTALARLIYRMCTLINAAVFGLC